MDEPTLDKADQEIMASRGWDPENTALAERYLDLRQDVTADRITEKDLNTEMNKLDNEQLASEKQAALREAALEVAPNENSERERQAAQERQKQEEQQH